MLFKRKQKRFPASLKVSLKKKGNESVFGKIKNISWDGIRAVFRHADPQKHSFIDLMIQKPKKNVFVPTNAEVRWKKPRRGKCEVGLKFGNLNPEAKAEILAYVRRRHIILSILKILLLVMIISLTIWYSLNRTPFIEMIQPKLAKANMFWSELSEKISKKIPYIFPKQYKINGIWHSVEYAPYVMIDDNVYLVNDIIRGGKISKISKAEITIEFPDGEKVYRLGNIIKP